MKTRITRKTVSLLLCITFVFSIFTAVPSFAADTAALRPYELSAEIRDRTHTVSLDTYDNDAFSLEIKETRNGLTGILTANKDITMKKLELSKRRVFSGDDRFFSNGYQSWSTSSEYRKTDKTATAMEIAKVSKLAWQVVTNSSDYNFANYGTPGVFHSWTVTYLRKAGSDTIEFYGSRSERNGFTKFEVDMQNGRFTIAKDIEGLKLKKGQQYQVFDLYKETGSYDTVFDHYFFDFCGLKRPTLPRMTGYTSWYNLEGDITEQTILRDLNGLDPAKDSVNIFQIDDGFEPHVGDWTKPNKKFPHGMKYVADRIHEKGYQAGIWLAPFVAAVSSDLVKQHPDWFLRNEKDHSLIVANANWYGSLALDLDNPEVKDYLRSEFDTILNDWGYDMVKLDFLYACAIQPRNGKTRGQLMAEGVDFLREICGDKIILGCGVPLGSCMGVFDACRIGPDETAEFGGNLFNSIGFNNEVPSTRYGITNALYRRFFNNRAFVNDPDVFYLRDGIQYTTDQKKLLAKINDLTGGILFMSDDPTTYRPGHWDMLNHVYKDKDYSVLSVESDNKDHFTVRFTEDGVPKTLTFDITDGSGNISQVW